MTSASYQIKSKNNLTKTKPEKPFSLPFNHTDFCQTIYESVFPQLMVQVLRIDAMQLL